MISIQIRPLAGALLLLLLSGCITVKDTLMLRNVEVEAGLPQPPVHVTTGSGSAGNIHLSPFVAVGTGSLSATLDHQYEGPIVEGLSGFDAEGLHWNLPPLTYGVHLDLAGERGLALSAGAAASAGGGRQSASLYGGIGLFSALEAGGMRFDVGLQFIDVWYEGATVVLRTIDRAPSDTLYFHDRGTRLQPNVYANLTLNSTREDWPANWFVQFGVSPQRLTSFVPREQALTIPSHYVVDDQRAESSALWLVVTPGIYLSLPDDHRLLLGFRVLKEIQLESTRPGFVVMPMASFDWRL